MKLCDLHAHSNYSDGTLTPAQLVRLAQQQNLEALVLCDHNTVAGLPAFLKAAEGSTVEPVPGVEFSTEYGDTELHLLMLFVKPEDYGPVTEVTQQLRRNKEQSNRDLIRALRADGIDIDYDAMLAASPDGYINRAHIGAELTRMGLTPSIQDSFKTYLAVGGGYFTPPKRPDVLETIRFIKSRGGVAVLAHPFLNLEEGQLETFLPQAVSCGLDAMETMYAKYDGETTEKAKKMAAWFGLLESGGSDFHGENKPDIALGSGRGNLQIPVTVLEKLKAKKR